jgi:gamma-glutamylaminecyclotransferase
MCIIIVKQDNDKVIRQDTLIASATKNPHGLGVLWLDKWNIEYFNSEDYRVLLTKRPFIAHFRYATVGKVSRENCHPFNINKNEVLFQNGTIYNLGDADTTDTEAMAVILRDIPKKHWADVLEMNDCRFVTANLKTKTFELYNKQDWVQRNGIYYSKKNVLDLTAIAVYGTLKKDYSNYHGYLKSAAYVGRGETKDKYPLVVTGLPYLLNKKGVGHNVEVDVFLVDSYTLSKVDSLEGHPNWYERKKIKIDLGDNQYISAWIYFNDTEDTGVYHQAYTQEVRSSSYLGYDIWNSWDDIDEVGDDFGTAKYEPKPSHEACFCGDQLYDDPFYPGEKYCMSCEDYVTV